MGASDLTRYFKPENLQPVGATTVDATPRAGVTIRRDSYGVPHIYGRTRADVWYGVGWITAADRGLLLQQGRGAARAAVAEVPGLDAFSLVTGLRSFTPSRQAERLVSSEQRALVRTHGDKGRQILRDMDEYGAGINAWYASRPGPPPARWTRNDTIAVFAFIGSIFGNGGGAEAQNAEFLSSLRRRLGRRRAARAFLDLMSADDPEHATTIRRRYRNGRESARPTKGSPLVDAGKLKLTPDPSKRTEASNFLVVGDSRTAGANTQAVMGPQLGYFYPQIVLEAGLHGPGLEAQGAHRPGHRPVRADRAHARLLVEPDDRPERQPRRVPRAPLRQAALPLQGALPADEALRRRRARGRRRPARQAADLLHHGPRARVRHGPRGRQGATRSCGRARPTSATSPRSRRCAT